MYKKLLSLAALCAALGGCAHTAPSVANQIPIGWTSENDKKIVMIDPDVELSEVTAGGLNEPRADWTATGKGFIKADISDLLAKKNINVVVAENITDPHAAQLIKLHAAVGEAMVFNRVFPLPTKVGAMEWTLGPGAAALRQAYGGDYALFVHVRDSYSSASRMALRIAVAMVGVGMSGGQQVAFASLVDLRTGRVVWFNTLANNWGSLKEEKPASDTVNNLFQGLPL